MFRMTMLMALPVMVMGCSGPTVDNNSIDDAAMANAGIVVDQPISIDGNTALPAVEATAAAFTWPATLNVFGDGFPRVGDPCRNLGESGATVDFLDDSATLVGCPGGEMSAGAQNLVQAGGKLVGTHAGVAMISIPGAIATSMKAQDQGMTTN